MNFALKKATKSGIKTEPRFGFSTENYSGIKLNEHIGYILLTNVICLDGPRNFQ